MKAIRWVSWVLLVLPWSAYDAQGQNKTPPPKLEPIAETKLIMEGLVHANFRGLERILTQPPKEAQGWTYARGQALLIAESGNLLMLRPPRNQGESPWMDRAMELRRQATTLGRLLADRDLDAAKQGLRQLSTSCNQCHKTFRVPIEIAPFQQAMP